MSATQPLLASRYQLIDFIESKHWFCSWNFLFSNNPSNIFNLCGFAIQIRENPDICVKSVRFMNQSKWTIEPCDCINQSIFVKKSHNRFGKSFFRITDIRSRQTVEVERLISLLLRHKNIKLVFWYWIQILKVKINRNYISKYNLYLYFLI